MSQADITIPAADAAPKIVFEIHEQIIAYSSLYGMTLLCVIWGSLRSLKFIKKHITKKEAIEASINVKKAFKFPITASIVLFSLYLLFKCDAECRNNALDKVKEHAPPVVFEKYEEGVAFLHTKFPFLATFSANSTEETPEVVPENDLQHVRQFFNNTVKPLITKENCMFLLLVLLCYEGTFALAAILNGLFSKIYRIVTLGFFTKSTFRIKFDDGKDGWNEEEAENAKETDWKKTSAIYYDSHYLVTLAFCSVLGIRHLISRHFITNDLMGIAFSIVGIEALHLSSFKAGVVLLSGLFFYDIFWVFGTEVMTTVAKSIDAPILLQFPQDILRNGLFSNKHAMIGLGDIVIPGIFIALIYRFDNRNFLRGKVEARKYFYFATSIVAYAIGLCITMGIMHFFKAAQPALLYLVPCCILIPLGVAKLFGEADVLWNYSEDQFVTPGDKKDDKKKKN